MTGASGNRPDGRPVFLLAPDSFKGSLTSPQVAAALESGLRQAFPDATYRGVPIADGGEGTVAALVAASGGETRRCLVTGPLGTPVVAEFGFLGDGTTAVIELASASGLPLVPSQLRDPRVTSTRGTGELLVRALDAGARRIILGIGGSATNDGGAGLLSALGARFLDGSGEELVEGGAALAHLDRIDLSGLDPRLADVRLDVACDVTNPLCGPNGASAVYGPQKGASAETVAELDASLAHFAQISLRETGRSVAHVPGAGAAGGVGAGLLAFTSATLTPGVDLILDAVGLADLVADCDLVITGEGRLDGQTRFGKAPAGVAAVARRHGKPVIAVAGSLGVGADDLVPDIFDAIFPTVDRLTTLDEALAHAGQNVQRTARMIGTLLGLSSGWWTSSGGSS